MKAVTYQKIISNVCEKNPQLVDSKSSSHKYVLNVFISKTEQYSDVFSIWTVRSFHLHTVKDRIT